MELTTGLKVILWKIANLALECKDVNTNGEEYEQKAFELIKEVQKEAYNQAIRDAAENADWESNNECTEIWVDKQSILKLLK